MDNLVIAIHSCVDWYDFIIQRQFYVMFQDIGLIFIWHWCADMAKLAIFIKYLKKGLVDSKVIYMSYAIYTMLLYSYITK